MAEPARKLDEESSSTPQRPQLRAVSGGGQSTPGRGNLQGVHYEPGVYDTDDAQPVTRPSLRAVPGGGQSTSRRSGHLRSISSAEDLQRDETAPSAPAVDQASATETGQLNTAAGVPSLFRQNETNTEDSNGDKKRSIRGFIRRRRKSFMVTAFVSTIIGLILSFLPVGPLKLVHFSQILQQFHLQGNSDQSNDRLIKLFTFAKDPTKPQNLRLGILGNHFADKMTNEMVKIGIDPQFTKGQLLKINIDPAKFAAADGTFDGKTGNDFIQQFKDTYGVELSLGPNGSIYYDSAKLGNMFKVKGDFKALVTTSLDSLEVNKVASFLGTRIMAERAGFKSALHPVKAAKSAALRAALAKTGKTPQQIDDAEEQAVQSDEVSVVENGTDTAAFASDNTDTSGDGKDAQAQQAAQDNANATEDQANQLATQGEQAGQELAAGDSKGVTGLKDSIKSNLGKGATVGGLGIAALCILLGIAQKADAETQQNIQEPEARIGAFFTALGNQVQAGIDMDATDANTLSKQLVDTSSNPATDITNAKSIQAELGQPQLGPDIDASAKPVGQQNVITQALSSIPGLNTICSVANGPVGTVLTFLGGPISVALSYAASAAIEPLANIAAGWLSKHPVNPLPYGAALGNTANYGTRLVGDWTAAATGGSVLNDAQSQQLTAYNYQEQQKNFESHSYAYRLLNPYDSHSLVAQLIDKSSTDPKQNIASIFGGLLNAGRSFATLPAKLFTTHANAAPVAYDYGFPQIGVPLEERNDAAFNDPYDNATQAAAILAGPNGQTYIDRASKCFGDQLGADGSINFNTGIVPTFSDMQNNNCNDTTLDWQRVAMYVGDTADMEGLACSYGDDQSCADMGMDTSGGTGSINEQRQEAIAYARAANNPGQGPDLLQLGGVSDTLDSFAKLLHKAFAW